MRRALTAGEEQFILIFSSELSSIHDCECRTTFEKSARRSHLALCHAHAKDKEATQIDENAGSSKTPEHIVNNLSSSKRITDSPGNV
jgi:hypothetical protein